MAHTSEYSKTVKIYLQDHNFKPYPLNFYPGIKEEELNLIISETIRDLKSHSKNTNLKAWNRLDGKELDSQYFYRSNSIILSDEQPNNKTFIPADWTPRDIYDPTEDILTENQIKKISDSMKPKNSKPAEDHSNNTTIIEKSSPGPSPRQGIRLGTKNRKVRPKSAAKSCLKNYRAPQNLLIARPVNEISFFPRSDSSKNLAVSHDRFDSSLTFNPLKNHPNGEQQGSSLGFFQKKDAQNSSRYILPNEPQSLHEENKGEENYKKKSDGDKSFRKPQLSEGLKIQKCSSYNTGDVAISPIDGNDPVIYSFIKGLSPFSYFIEAIENKFNPKWPPPVYLSYQTLANKKPLQKKELLEGLEITPIGELKLVDEEILKQQKGIVADMLQSLMKSLAEGRGVVGVSLPVRIFEPRSLIERICDWWTFIPNYIVPAAKLKDPVGRMKKVIAAAIGGLYVSAKQLKPFNPLLGETFQATFPREDISINAEHISHHPPIANFYLKHHDFKFWGTYEFLAKLEGFTKNIVIMHQKGPNHIDFSDGHRITFFWPSFQLEGVMHGDRTCRYIESMKFVDERNKIKAIIKFGSSGEHQAFPKKRTDAFHGKIYKFKNMEQNNSKKKPDKNIDINYQDMSEQICDIYGSWLEYLKINGEEIWNIDKDVPTQYYPIEHPLPSDARFREDLIWMYRGNKKYAQEWKLKLEERQRHEKKLRLDYSKKQKKG